MGKKEQIIKKLSQDLKIRIVITGVGFFLLLFIWILGEIINLWPLFILAISVFVLNWIIYYLLKNERINETTEYIVSIVDISLITYVVSVTGAIKSPFYLIYILVILIEGLYANPTHVKYNAILSYLFYSVLSIFSVHGKLTKDMTILLVSKQVFLLLSSGVALYYAKILSSQNAQLEYSNAEITRLYNKVKNFNEELEQRVKTVTEELNEKIDDIQHLFVNTVKALSSAIVAKDPYTKGHNDRILNYTLAILEELREKPGFDFNYEQIRGTLQLAALLHDIGKIGIPDEILQKPGPLAPEEWDVVKQHITKGVSILEPIKEFKEVVDVVEHHHERYDGKGYLEGLSGEQIPLLARIISVADTFDAMTSDRPYRKRAKDEEAIEEIKNCAGGQFDPIVVEAFLRAYDKGNIKSA